MKNPNAAANLTKKGAAANPNGRPKKGYSITEWFKEMLSKNPEVKDQIGNAIVQKAREGDSAAMKLVWNYMDGLPQQSLDVKGKIETFVGANYVTGTSDSITDGSGEGSSQV